MLKVFKYLKSSILTILLIIILLVLQAFCDLALPDYTSKIVNIGIQQGGIENAAATVISEKTYKELEVFMSDADKTYLNKYYKLIKTSEYNNYKKYSILKKENVYVLNTSSSTIENKISDILQTPFVIYYMFNSGKASQYGVNIPKGIDVNTLLVSMNKMQVDAMLTKINKTISTMPDSIVSSAAILGVKAEYQNVGLNTSTIQTNYVLISGAKMLGIALCIMALAVTVGLLGARIASKLAQTLRQNVFEKVTSFSKNEMKKYGSASLITRTTNDIQQVQQIMVFLMRVVFYAPIIAIGGVLKATSKSGSMGWIILAAILTIMLIMIVMVVAVMPKFKKLQNLVDKLNLVTREILTGIPVIRAFNNEKHEEKRFDTANSNLTKVNLFVNRVMALMMPLMTLIMYAVMIAIVWKGAYNVNDGSMQVGDIMAYMQYAMQIIMAFLMIGMMSIMLPRAAVSARRIMEVIDTDPIIKNKDNIIKLDESKKGLVEFENVCFRYPDATEDVITDISFKAKPGTTTAFIGSTGSGKSTLINLIPRFYDVTDGTIKVDGVDIKDADIHDLRSKIGYVPQKGMLFSGTVESNIKYGNNKITDNDMYEAAKVAQADEFINNLDDKYQANIAQGGTNVSGGQRQRLSIARAIAINPEIYIFDDSFSALDFKTDARLRAELAKITKESTVLIVAQRISTVLGADQIVVLNEGKVAGIGSHKELMKNCEVYKEIALSQLSEEELNNV